MLNTAMKPPAYTESRKGDLCNEIKGLIALTGASRQLSEAALNIYSFARSVDAYEDHHGTIHIKADQQTAYPYLKGFKYVKGLAKQANAEKQFTLAARLLGLSRIATFYGYPVPTPTAEDSVTSKLSPVE